MIEIREATTPNDLEAARSLIHALIDWLRQVYPEAREVFDQDAQTVEADLASLTGAEGPPSGKLLVAYSNGEVAGTVALRDQGQRCCEMKCMFVPEPFRGQGLGRALALALINDARAQGYVHMRLSTGIRQVAARGLYHRLGFQESHPYHEAPKSLRAALVFMELRLSAITSTEGRAPDEQAL